jgi:hypothetical protein
MSASKQPFWLCERLFCKLPNFSMATSRAMAQRKR